ncbi:MAG: DEAD/DEAH box helicase family protein [Elusimicrobiota bacterium]|jgi:type I restriction enzyme R subunit|nr:DEAD/DEAH box helicase family protein [Elusimicrobiota bacterium]MDR0676867.1 DEAD/DEAH box helicase family protein [Elusimicrobiota bacterium]
MSEILTEEDVKLRFITPALTNKGWTADQMRMEKAIRRDSKFTDGKVIIKGNTAKRGNPLKADYVLYHHNNFPIAVIEAKKAVLNIGDGIQQAIDYAKRLDIPFAYASNGKGFLEHDFLTGFEREIALNDFPTADELWKRRNAKEQITPAIEKVINQPYFFCEGWYVPRYYQRIAVNRTVEAVAKNQRRLLLVMATGTGKTFTAFQIIHKLYESSAVKKVLYLADRNILIDQTILNDFAPFKDKNILTKVENKTLDSAYDIFMSLYHQLSGDDELETFRQFSPDFFDLIIVDECHRGSAKENSRWRKILDYFTNAIHIGMTATPKETDDVSNSLYFGDAIYTYSLKQGIDDGFLAPYRVLRIGIDKDLEGYIPEAGKVDDYGNELPQKVFTSKDFDRTLIIDERTKIVARRITEFLKQNDRYAKTIVFCVDEDHALRMRQALVNENNDLIKINDKFVMRITGSDQLGKQQLENFIDNNTKYPTIVTTSELLSTGVDCQMVKVIVLDAVINSMTKFKQIIGRGTRLVWNKDKRYFTILDFRKATLKFSDPEFDGPASSVYDIDKNKPLPTPTVDDDFDDIGDLDDVNPRKYRVSDVPASIISELELIYGENGRLVVNHSYNFKSLIIERYPTAETFIADWHDGNKQEILDYFEEKGVDLNRFKEKVGKDVDIYDIILMIGFDKEAKIKTERINDVKNDEFYQKLSDRIIFDKIHRF